MGKRSLKGQVANLASSFLRFLNMVIIAGGFAAFIIMFVINSDPSPAGWGFVFLGLFTCISGLFGAISSGQIGCYSCHLFALFISSAGLCASFLVIFLRLDNVLSNLHSKKTPYDAKHLLRIEGAIFFVLFMFQLVVLLLACMVHQCGLLEFNEDLEAIPSARDTARLQQETDIKRTKVETSSAHRLAEKMKQKYGQWTKKTSDYDIETQPVKPYSN